MTTLDSAGSYDAPAPRGLTIGFAFGVIALALTAMTASDALLPLLASGGKEADIDMAGTGRVRALGWLACFGLFAPCFLLHWRQTIDAVRGNALMSALIALCIVSAFWAQSFLPSFSSAVQLSLLTLFGLVIPRILTVREIVWTLIIVHSGLLILSVLFILTVPQLGISSSIMYKGAWRGVFIHKNHFGTFLSLTAALFAGWALLLNRHYIVAAGVIAVCGALCVLARSTTGMLLCAMAPVIMIAGGWVRDRRAAMLLLGLALFLGAMAVSLLVFFWSEILGAAGKDPTLSGRTELWAAVIDSWSQRPIFGFGYNAYWSSTGPYGGVHVTNAIVWNPLGAHNGWLEIIVQLGLSGLLLALWAFLRTGYRLFAAAGEVEKRCLLPLFVVLSGWSLVQANILRDGNYLHFNFAMILAAVVTANKGLTGTSERH